MNWSVLRHISYHVHLGYSLASPIICSLHDAPLVCPMSTRLSLVKLTSRTGAQTLICSRCAFRLALNAKSYRLRSLHTSARVRQVLVSKGEGLDRAFFWTNALKSSRDGLAGVDTDLTRRQASHTTIAQSTSIDTTHISAIADEAPHRRRKRLKAEATAPSTITFPSHSTSEAPLPPDASSTLSQTAAAAPAKSWKRVFSSYLALTKPRLAFLIVLTTTASYSIYPVPDMLSTAATDAPSLSTLTLLFLTSGTFWCIASANTLNMLFEPEYDAKMSRTRNRPLVRGLVSKRAALLFAMATGLLGTGVLWYGVNPTTAVLGASNIALYAFAYTPLKRMHPVNTWVGAIVGAIPPLMGWCAAASQYSTTVPTDRSPTSLWSEASELLFTEQAIGGWLLAALLFAWQFPHFFALSYGVRQEYAGAGYKMLTSSNMAMASRVSLRYSLAMFPICAGLSYYEVTDPAFVVTSSVINGWMLREAIRMWKHNGERGTARALFWASVWQLPIALVLAMLQKRGLWTRIYHGVMGQPIEDDEWLDDEDEPTVKL